jgi:hypothetical protein
MVNHPNRTATPFHVHAYPGGLLGKFRSAMAAQRVAQVWSERWSSWAEVYSVRKGDGSGIIGQYTKGIATPEFAARGDAALPGWPNRT